MTFALMWLLEKCLAVAPLVQSLMYGTAWTQLATVASFFNVELVYSFVGPVVLSSGWVIGNCQLWTLCGTADRFSPRGGAGHPGETKPIA